LYLKIPVLWGSMPFVVFAVPALVTTMHFYFSVVFLLPRLCALLVVVFSFELLLIVNGDVISKS